jgi:DNA-binding MarR family transcriptional regulator
MLNRPQYIKEIMECLHFQGKIITRCISSFENKITPSQMVIMGVVEESKIVTIKHIAKELQISSSAATQLVNELVKKGYLKRKTSDTDRREVSIELTEKFKKNITFIKKHIVGNMTILFKDLSDNELRQYLEVNKKIIKNYLK